MIYKSDKELQQACEQWQKTIGVQDWDVRCKITRTKDMTLEGVQGQCQWNISSKTATIRILDPVDYPDDEQWPQDMENTLIHELIHLHSAPFDTFSSDSAENIGLEQMICKLSDALVNLKRM